MSSRKMRILFNISIIVSLLIGLISIIFFGHFVMWVTGSTQSLADNTTAYVGMFLAVVFLSHKFFGLILRRFL